MKLSSLLRKLVFLLALYLGSTSMYSQVNIEWKGPIDKAISQWGRYVGETKTSYIFYESKLNYKALGASSIRTFTGLSKTDYSVVYEITFFLVNEQGYRVAGMPTLVGEELHVYYNDNNVFYLNTFNANTGEQVIKNEKVFQLDYDIDDPTGKGVWYAYSRIKESGIISGVIGMEIKDGADTKDIGKQLFVYNPKTKKSRVCDLPTEKRTLNDFLLYAENGNIYNVRKDGNALVLIMLDAKRNLKKTEEKIDFQKLGITGEIQVSRVQSLESARGLEFFVLYSTPHEYKGARTGTIYTTPKLTGIVSFKVDPETMYITDLKKTEFKDAIAEVAKVHSESGQGDLTLEHSVLSLEAGNKMMLIELESCGTFFTSDCKYYETLILFMDAQNEITSEQVIRKYQDNSTTDFKVGDYNSFVVCKKSADSYFLFFNDHIENKGDVKFKDFELYKGKKGYVVGYEIIPSEQKVTKINVQNSIAEMSINTKTERFEYLETPISFVPGRIKKKLYIGQIK